MRVALVTHVALVALGALAATLGACDPVHSHAVDDLGGEAPGVRTGPTHRPGQPCLTCHDGALGDPSEFSVAGTIFRTADAKDAASGATISLTDATGATYEATANEVGNFYVAPRELTPTYPMHVSVTYDGVEVKMVSHVGRSGSCADCHFDPYGPTSAGHVYVPLDGVTP